MNEKLRALLILLIIIVAILPVYMINKYLQKSIRPRESMARLFMYLLSALVLIFIFTFLIVLVIGKLFHGASR
jgi:hypothetical protein